MWFILTENGLSTNLLTYTFGFLTEVRKELLLSAKGLLIGSVVSLYWTEQSELLIIITTCSQIESWQ